LFGTIKNDSFLFFFLSFLFALYFLFVLIQKETKKSRQKQMLRCFCQGQRTGEHSDILTTLFVFGLIVLFENTAGAVSR
jgi:hypothetical protein